MGREEALTAIGVAGSVNPDDDLRDYKPGQSRDFSTPPKKNIQEHMNTDIDSGDSDDSDEDDAEAEDLTTADSDGVQTLGGESDAPKRKNILETIGDIISGKKDTDHTDSDSNEDGTDQDSDVESDDGADSDSHDDGDTGEDVFVDPRFMLIAGEYGWPDTQIIDYASKNNAVDQVALANQMEMSLGTSEPMDGDNQLQPVVSQDVLDKLMEDEDNAPLIEGVVKPLLQQIQEQSQQLHELKGNDTERNVDNDRKQVLADYDAANKIFDQHAVEYEVLGKTKALPKLPNGKLDVRDPAVKARGEVFQRAKAYKQMNPNATVQESMEDAMVWFRGKYGQDHMEKTILKKLRKQSKKVSPKTRSTKRVTKFTNDRERKASVVFEAMNKNERN